MRVEGAVTSLTCRGQDDQFFIGTNKCQMYRSAYATFKEELVAVCHTEAVNDIVFPEGHSDLFVTCSTNDIRVWYTPERLERLRVTVPNVTCHAVEVTRDGMVIISAWNDGKIRAFVPATGEPMYEINNAHNLGVTAIAATSDCKQIISGGGDGQVRIWNIGEKTQKLREVLKEHRGAVSCIKINKNDKEGVTASLDGTCVIWDLVRYVRKQMILDNTLFKCVCYHPGEYQIITSGTDRKIVYWEVLDGSAIREVQGSLSSSINGMDITSDGASFVTDSMLWALSARAGFTSSAAALAVVWKAGANPGMWDRHNGLRNHGNTCFMNAVVQCLSNTAPLAEFLALGRYRARGARAEVTHRLAALVRALWTRDYTPQLSAEFKNIVSEHSAQFRGNAQHDALEFLLWLLDRMHEDLGGGGGQALSLDANLLWGHTERCETFDNPPLCQENFKVQLLEVWGFQNAQVP
ncbi:hypothetical protein Q9233_014016 [Columba guinea]|nr:hypothetical protein Q9233_014016 [Columba guinea]